MMVNTLFSQAIQISTNHHFRKELIEHANAKVGDMLRVAIDDYDS